MIFLFILGWLAGFSFAMGLLDYSDLTNPKRFWFPMSAVLSMAAVMVWVQL